MVLIGVIVAMSILAKSLPLSSATISKRISDHGNPNLICLPTKWTDIVIFLLGNYIAHAATVKSNPGESTKSTVANVVGALLFPTSGVFRGVSAIASLGIFAKTPLQTAARAGALCMVVRTKKWRPLPGNTNSDVIIMHPETSHASSESEGTAYCFVKHSMILIWF